MKVIRWTIFGLAVALIVGAIAMQYFGPLVASLVAILVFNLFAFAMLINRSLWDADEPEKIKQDRGDDESEDEDN
ncbi:MAG TPA: hypothetical protein VFV23_14760 [Verrucomicrobiae bacterium]|nr:hypothetical protein [Verrucomicrobiae bacterium]